MKVVINKCFGGFGLSTAVQEELIKLGVPFFKDFDHIPKDHTGVYIVGYGEKYADNFRDDEHRSNPLLIQAIETVGIENASASLATNLKIIEIPDGIDFQIDDYDGVESIHETHRSW